MLLDSCFESYQSYPAPDQYYYSQASCPPSPLSHPPSPSIYSPSPSLYSPCSNNFFQFPPAPFTDISSTIKEEPLPWKVSTLDLPSISSPTHTPTYHSPSPLLSQSTTHINPPPNSLCPQTSSHLPETIRSSNSSIHSYSISNAYPHCFPNQMVGTFGHSLASFHHNSSSNMEVISSPHSYNISPPGSGYSSPAPELSTDVFHPSSQHDQFIQHMHAQIDTSSSLPAPFPSLSPPATITPDCGGEAPGSSIKEEACEEEPTIACKWRECGKEYNDKHHLVEHINTTHIEHKKGCEEYPCYWVVSSPALHKLS